MSQPDQRAVILDMDLGIDDAIALLYLASRPNVSIEAAGSVHGNTPADLAAGNLRRVLALAGLPAVPVARGAMRPLVRDAHFAGEVHGDDGLGNTRRARRCRARRRRPRERPGAARAARPVRARPV